MGCAHSNGYLDMKHFDYDSLANGTPDIKLSDDEMNLVKKTWDSVTDKVDLGINVMIRIFTVHSDIKHVWIFAANLETEAEMRSNSQLRYHATKLTSTITNLISDLQPQLDNHKDMLIKLGMKHYHYGLKYKYFMFFQESVLFALEKVINDNKVFNKEAKNAFYKLLLIVAGYLSIGIKQEEEQNGDVE